MPHSPHSPHFPAALLALCLWGSTLSPTASAAESHTFTDPYGRQLTGKITSVAGETMTLSLDGSGKEVAVPFDKLSKADIEFIKKWVVDNPQAMTFRLRVMGDVFDEAKGKKLSSAEASKSQGALQYRVSISNQSGADISKITARYKVFLRNYVNLNYTAHNDLLYGKDSIAAKAGVMEIGTIPKDKRAEFMTDSVLVEEYRYSGANSDRLMGIILRIYSGAEMIKEVTLDITDGMDGVTWDSAVPEKKPSKKGKTPPAKVIIQ